MAIEERICQKEHSLFGIHDMHGADMVQSLADADYLFGYGCSVGILAENAGDHGIGFACFHHHHAEIVAFEHLLGSFFQRHPLSVPFFGKDLCISHAAFFFPVVPQVHNLYSFEVDLVLPCHIANLLLIAQQHRVADTFRAGCFSSFEHIQMVGLGENHPFGVLACHFIETAYQLVVEPHQIAQLVIIFIPVGDRLACYSRCHRSLGYGRSHRGEQARVERFGNDVFFSEAKFLYAVGRIHHVRHSLLGQLGQGIDCGNFHLFVDAGGLYVEGTAKNIGKTQYIVDLVGIVGSAGGEDDILPRGHGQLVGNLRVGICQCEDDGIVVH